MPVLVVRGGGVRKEKPAATYFPALAVSSAQEGLTSVFGMGTGIAPPLWPPALKTMPRMLPLFKKAQKAAEGKRKKNRLIRKTGTIIWPSLTAY